MCQCAYFTEKVTSYTTKRFVVFGCRRSFILGFRTLRGHTTKSGVVKSANMPCRTTKMCLTDTSILGIARALLKICTTWSWKFWRNLRLEIELIFCLNVLLNNLIHILEVPFLMNKQSAIFSVLIFI